MFTPWRSIVLLLSVFVLACIVAGCQAAQAPPSTLTVAEKLAATATAGVVEYGLTVEAQRSPDVPPLPFADNPDPLLCGIPTAWGADSQAWLSGYYEGELIRPKVFLYDSHLRLNILASADSGAPVEVLLYQQNPEIDYYLVKLTGVSPPNEGWVPAPFLSFDPPSE